MSDTLRACLWMIGAIVSFTSMALAGRAVSLDLDTFEIMMYRSLIGIGLVLGIATAAGTLRQITTRSPGLHLIRNVSHFTGQNFWFYAIATIPLAQVFALEFTSPLWVMVLSPLVLGERLTRVRAAAALVGFVGILIVTRPTPDTVSFGLLAAALAAIGFAGSAVFTRRLTRTEIDHLHPVLPDRPAIGVRRDLCRHRRRHRLAHRRELAFHRAHCLRRAAGAFLPDDGLAYRARNSRDADRLCPIADHRDHRHAGLCGTSGPIRDPGRRGDLCGQLLQYLERNQGSARNMT